MTQLCTRFSGISIASELKDKIVTSHSSESGTSQISVLLLLYINLCTCYRQYLGWPRYQLVVDSVKFC